MFQRCLGRGDLCGNEGLFRGTRSGLDPVRLQNGNLSQIRWMRQERRRSREELTTRKRFDSGEATARGGVARRTVGRATGRTTGRVADESTGRRNEADETEREEGDGERSTVRGVRQIHARQVSRRQIRRSSTNVVATRGGVHGGPKFRRFDVRNA